MASIFRSPVGKAIEGLTKHLALLESDDEDKRSKAIVKLSDDIAAIHFILYGDSDKDPNPDHITKLVPKLLQPDTDLFCKLAQNLTLFEFEAKKQTAGIMNYIIRRCSKYGADAYIKAKTDKHGHNVIIDCLLRGYHDQHLAQNVGSVLQEMAKRAELAPMLLNTIRITRKKIKPQPSAADKSDEKSSESKPDVNTEPEEELEERQVVDELFVLVEKPSFDVASDAYKTLSLLLTRNKKLVPAYLNAHYTEFFAGFNRLIQSDNYVTKRQFLNLLSELLLEKSNFALMIRYIAEKENLKIAMTLLKSDSHAISHEAFHIFKVFVANPKKARDIHIVLWKNKEKLINFLEGFLPEKAKEDEAFAEEKKIVIKHLRELPVPEEVAKYKAQKREEQRQKAEAEAEAAKKEAETAEGDKEEQQQQQEEKEDGGDKEEAAKEEEVLPEEVVEKEEAAASPKVAETQEEQEQPQGGGDE